MSSYPTYEEWKRRIACGGQSGSAGSYPTYEEWKLSSSFIVLLRLYEFLSYLRGMETFCVPPSVLSFMCSYPTYEEWKPS